jgi:hypothetical protein
MAISKEYILSLVIGLTLLCCACTKEGSDNGDKRSGQSQGQETADAGLVKVIKNGKLANFPTASIGKAFDSYKYLIRKEWKEKQLKSGHLTVDFTGWFEPRFLDEKARQEGVTDRGLEITFVINPDGSFYLFMISALDRKSDGNVHRDRLPDTTAVLENIYANNKITL